MSALLHRRFIFIAILAAISAIALVQEISGVETGTHGYLLTDQFRPTK